MPKQRSTGIANRNERNVSFDEQEMSERMQQRLMDVGPIEVMVESRTRQRIEAVTVSFFDSEASVSSQNGNSYVVDFERDTCTCPDYINRESRCRHIEAVALAREQVAQGTFLGSQTDSNINSNQFTNEYAQNEIHAEGSRQRNYTDDNFFYIENEDVFREDTRRLEGAAVPFYTENVLNGSDITFGIELEFVEGDSNEIARELYELGICSSPNMVGYHSARNPNQWVLERDGSVTRGNRGGEIISPILQDTPETWNQIKKICEVAKRHGARVNGDTGGHIHIGAEAVLDGKRQRWRRFFKATTGFEKVFHRLAGGEQGQFRNSHYAPSSLAQNKKGITARMPKEGSTRDFQSIISSISRGKYQSINLGAFSSKKTIEFRAFNGTLEPGIIQANVKYSAGILNTSERSKIKMNEGIVSTDTDRKRGRIINEYESNNQESDTAIMKALDAIFSRKEDKEQVLSVILKNHWS